VPRGRLPGFALLWVGFIFTTAISTAVFCWPLFDCQLQFQTNALVCGDGTETTLRWNMFWGCVAFLCTLIAIAYVAFAAYKLTTIPRKNDPAVAAWTRTRDQEIAALNARRFKTPAPAAVAPNPFNTNPFGTGAAMGRIFDDDDASDESEEETAMDEAVAAPIERVKFDLSSALSANPNVLATSNLLPVQGVPVVSAAFCAERSSLVPQSRALR